MIQERKCLDANIKSNNFNKTKHDNCEHYESHFFSNFGLKNYISFSFPPTIICNETTKLHELRIKLKDFEHWKPRENSIGKASIGD